MTPYIIAAQFCFFLFGIYMAHQESKYSFYIGLANIAIQPVGIVLNAIKMLA